MPSRSRRRFVRTIVLGGGGLCLASACKGPGGALARTTPTHTVVSERFETCHQVRDGRAFPVPPASRRVEIAIVGGGPSGLIAGYRLRDRDILVLEKEPVVGGNARADEWRGISYAAGAITTAGNSPAMRLYQELGLRPTDLRRGDGPRPFIVGAKVYSNIWDDGVRDLYAGDVRRRILEARDALLDIDVHKRKSELDGMSLAELLAPHGSAAKAWFDDLLAWFGGTCEEYSGYAGVLLARSQMGQDLSLLYPERTPPDATYTFPGGLAAAAVALRDAIEMQGSGRVVTEATVYRVANVGDGVEVSYLAGSGSIPTTIRADAAIVAAPKFAARRIVANLPVTQQHAIERFSYVPFLVAGVCVNGVISATLRSARVLREPLANIRDAGPGVDRQLFRCEMPMRAQARVALQRDDYVHELGNQVVGFFNRVFPGSADQIEEVRIWRRGHNWYLPIPRMATELQPAAATPAGRIFFANADSVGDISEFGWALVAAERAVDQANAAVRRGRPSVSRPLAALEPLAPPARRV